MAAVPYDVVSVAEARELVRGRPHSFLRVTRPEVNLPEGVDPHSPEAHASAKESLERFVAEGVLRRDPKPGIFLYRLVTPEGHSQTGVAAAVSVDDYRSGVIRRHELTHRAKEEDRMRHALAIGAHPGPVLMAFRDDPAVDALTAEDTTAPPLYDFRSSDGVRHTLWRVQDPSAYVEAFGRHASAYIADGHHRSASAARVAEALRDQHPSAPEDASFNFFPAVLFPVGALNILPYHRVVRDLNGLDTDAVLERVAKLGTLEPGGDPRRLSPSSVALYLKGDWHILRFSRTPVDQADPIRSLDHDWVQRHILAGILGLEDPRDDPRMESVGGIRGLDALKARVDSGEMALALAMPPTPMEDVLRVADAGATMPPKSTWFEPKLRSGLLVHSMKDG